MSAIAVLGATGRTGRMVVEEALARGHTVTAIVRGAGTLAPARGLKEIIADPTVPRTLAGVLEEHDAVISALGAAGRGPTTLYSDSAAALVSAMPPDGRLLVVSSAGVSIPTDAGLTTRVSARMLHRIMRGVYTDMERMEQRLAASDLRWTCVRPTRLTDGPAGGDPRISVGANAKVGPRTSRADLACYLLAAVDDPHTYRTTVALSS